MYRPWLLALCFLPPLPLRERVADRLFAAHAYWAMPLPNDQFSLGTSTRLMNTSSLRRPGCRDSSSAILANNAFFCSVVRGLLAVIWIITRSSDRAISRYSLLHWH